MAPLHFKNPSQIKMPAFHAAAAVPPSLDTALANQHREIAFRRMLAAMSDNNRFSWRTLDRLALQAGVTEAEAHDILAAHPQEVALGRSKEGKVIVRLVGH